MTGFMSLIRKGCLTPSRYSVLCYLGSGNSNGYIKIGKSRDVSKREDSIRIGNADFKIIAFIDRDIENELHKKFSSKRVNGEWFDLSEKDIENIVNEHGFTRLRSSIKDRKV